MKAEVIPIEKKGTNRAPLLRCPRPDVSSYRKDGLVCQDTVCSKCEYLRSMEAQYTKCLYHAVQDLPDSQRKLYMQFHVSK